jgi:hypothetical protein
VLNKPSFAPLSGLFPAPRLAPATIVGIPEPCLDIPRHIIDIFSTYSTHLDIPRHECQGVCQVDTLDSLDSESTYPRHKTRQPRHRIPPTRSLIRVKVCQSVNRQPRQPRHSLEYRQLDSSSTELDSLDSLDKPRHSFDILDTGFPYFPVFFLFL